MLKHYLDILPFALPLFALFSMRDVENMVRWYFGFSECADGYINKADYWLTGGNGGRFRAAFPRKTELALLLLIVWYGYKLVKNSRFHLVYTYNLFVFGFILWPVANQIELLWRYDAPLYSICL